MRVYKVDLTIVGKIATIEPITFNTDKELSFGDIFNSDINIVSHPNGVRISSTVYTNDGDSACRVAILFIGRMLDILSTKINTALFVTNKDLNSKNIDKSNVSLVIDRKEFERCFESSRHLAHTQPTLLRALNWYRKGLYTEDPYDKFLALWNSVNVIAGKFSDSNEWTQKGIVNQIWDCFIRLWGKDFCDSTFKVAGKDLIKEKNDIRNSIAHGAIPVEINYVQNVISTLDHLQDLAYRFITEWSEKELKEKLL